MSQNVRATSQNSHSAPRAGEGGRGTAPAAIAGVSPGKPISAPSPVPLVMLRCPSCRKVIEAESTLHGTRCPNCDTGTLSVRVKLSRREREEHERAVGPVASSSYVDAITGKNPRARDALIAAIERRESA